MALAAALLPGGRLTWSQSPRYRDYMKSKDAVVGVRELRARLSGYLRAVARGETVTIGDRRRQPVARLVPVVRSVDDDALDRLAGRGVVQRGTGKPGGKPRIMSRTPRKLISDVVVRNRG